MTGGGRTNTWDSQNRLVSCTYNGTTSTFTYGADGLRRSSTVNGITTYYVYDGSTLIREMQRNTQTNALYNTATYLTGPRGPEYRRDDTATELDSQNRTVSKTRWYVYDGLGSVVGEVDPLGSLTSSPKYDVYGLVRSNSGTASSKMGFVGGLGHLSEANTGLIYMRARYYDPQQGRFASEDTNGSGINWFMYANDNPVNEVDRDGKDATTTDLYLIGGAAALSAALLYMQLAGRLNFYAAGLTQAKYVIMATACASLASWSFAHAAVGVDSSGVSSQINDALGVMMPIITMITAAGAAVGNTGPAWAAVAATYAYELVVVGYCIASDVNEVP